MRSTTDKIIQPLAWLYALSNFQLVSIRPPTNLIISKINHWTGNRDHKRALIWAYGQRCKRIQKSHRSFSLQFHSWRRLVSCSTHAPGSEDWTLHARTTPCGILFSILRLFHRYPDQLCCNTMGPEHQNRVLERKCR